MKGGKSPLKTKLRSGGYTIVEVMIVLAVSGVMFVIAANFINGKQARASFTSGVNEMASRVQGTIDQVADGRFSDVKLVCSTSGGTVQVSLPTGPNNGGQGRNASCVFLGKLMHFRVEGNPQKYETFVLAGKREATDLNSAQVGAVYSSDPNLNLTVTSNVPQGLDATKVMVAGTPVYGLGFVRDPSNGVNVTAQYATLGNNMAQATASGNITPGTLQPLNSEAIICMTDGTRYATVTVGKDGAKLRAQPQLGMSKAAWELKCPL